MKAAKLGHLKPVLVAYDYPNFAGPVGLAKASGAKAVVLDLPEDAREMAERMEVDLAAPLAG